MIISAIIIVIVIVFISLTGILILVVILSNGLMPVLYLTFLILLFSVARDRLSG